MAKSEEKAEKIPSNSEFDSKANNTDAPINQSPPPIVNPMMMGQMGMPPMMGPMGQYPNGMMGFGPLNFQYCKDPMEELSQCNGAIIRQEIEMFEAISGCETQNKYQVFIQSPMGIKFAFQCNERSGCCSRCCCSNDCRGLKIEIKHISSPAEYDADFAKVYIKAKKPCALGCCCLCRPQIKVSLKEGKKYLGKVREPFTCCDRDAEVYDEVGNLKYRIVGDCCQMGFCCGSSAEKLVEIEFVIKQNGQKVGFMKKMTSSYSEYFTKADSYKIIFPPNATPEEKMLLIVAGLLIDYQNFEKPETPQNNRRNERY